MRLFKSLSISMVITMIMSGVAYAATQSFTASIQFLTPLSFTSATNPNLGNWNTGASGRNFILNSDGSIAGTNSADYINHATAGSVNVVGSTADTVDIIANNFVANGGVSINDVPCKYGAAAATSCGTGITTAAAPGAGTALLLGVDVNTTVAHTDGQTATPGFDIVVSYN